jgi:signal transduction histidine kinase
MAERHLPDAVHGILHAPLGEDVSIPDMDPVQVPSRDEVGDVAEALNTVQLAALDLAVEQAVLRRNIADSFVNLGRRNQNLLSRQLDFITLLEANETDPDTLADLFKLDHLATRMRRNAESLLVLGGVTPPRRWAAPLPLIDVVRAALGEVEDYQRVVLRSIEPATVLGSAATDVAHVLAELVENALAFSAPGTSVEVYGRDGRGHPDGYIIAVVDYGPGMTLEDIEVANQRLAGTESFTVAPSRYLGHYVAGRLAARHGIAVEVDNPANTGLVATVTLPRSLLADSGPQPPTSSTAPIPAAIVATRATEARPPTTPGDPVHQATWPS